MADTGDIRVGTILRYNGELCLITEYIHRTPGNLRAFYQVKMKNLKTGKYVDPGDLCGSLSDLFGGSTVKYTAKAGSYCARFIAMEMRTALPL